jgi:cytoskeleton protein RodZ
LLPVVDAQDPSADTLQVAEATPVVQSLESSRPQNSSIERPVLSTIVMQFGEDSWVEVFDATSERVAFGIKKSGYTMTVAGKAPFSVVLAKHQKVSVSLDGEPVDLSYLPKNKLAKFKLPLAE